MQLNVTRLKYGERSVAYVHREANDIWTLLLEPPVRVAFGERFAFLTPDSSIDSAKRTGKRLFSYLTCGA